MTVQMEFAEVSNVLLTGGGGGVYQHDASRCTISEGYASIAFGDPQVDLALAVERKEIRLLPIVAAESQRQVQRQSLACISTSDPTFLGRLLTDRHLDDSL